MPRRFSRRNALLNASLVCISLAVAAVIGEIVLRALGYYGVRYSDVRLIEYVDDDVLDFRPIPNTTRIYNNIVYKTNEFGWRDYPYSHSKPANTFRILVIGDSVTWGLGVSLERTYAKHLEKELNQSGHAGVEYQVVVVSLAALNVEQEAHLLEVEGLKYDPDLVVVGYALNDPDDGVSFGRQKREKSARKRPSFFLKAKKLLAQSSLIHYTFRFAQKIVWNVRVLVGKDETGWRVKGGYFTSLYEDPTKWERVVRAFQKIEQIANEREIPVVLTVFPLMSDLDDYRWSSIHERIASAASDCGFFVLDLLPHFRRHHERELQVASGDHIHPNELGHRIAGDALHQVILEEGLVQARR